MMYKDRIEAGKLLGFHLKSNLTGVSSKDIVVVGLARGGVIIAAEIAKEFDSLLDVVVVKKIGHPQNTEYAVAAVSENEIFLNVDEKVPSSFLKDQATLARQQIKEKLALYRGAKSLSNLENKVVILADDGIATGLSMRCAIAQIRRHKPRKVYVAVPVGATESIKNIVQDADQIFSLYTPAVFQAIGQFYKDFPQITDEEVVNALKKFA